MLLSGIPMFVIFDPRYETSTTVFVVNSRCTDAFHCCTYPDPSPASTAKTPCPRPASGVGLTGVTVGPFDSTNAGEMLSSVRSDTSCRNGKFGVVNGVVIPAISIQTRPYPELRMVLSVRRYTAPKRGPKLFFLSGRTGSFPG